MALTATAVPRVRDDIIRTLSMKAPHVAQSSYDRPNLEIRVAVKTGTRQQELLYGARF
jgi:superfamily II DNA helicase RecQ